MADKIESAIAFLNKHHPVSDNARWLVTDLTHIVTELRDDYKKDGSVKDNDE